MSHLNVLVISMCLVACCRDTPYDFRAGLSEDGAENAELVGARISETPDGMGYDTVYVLDDLPIDTAPEAAGSGDTAVSSAPAASVSTAAASADLEPEPEVEPEVDVRRLGSTTMRPAARLVDEVSGRVMEVSTNQSCLICYSANYLQPKNSGANGEGGEQNGRKRGKRGRRRGRRNGRNSQEDENSGSQKDKQAPPARTSGDSGTGTTRKSNSAGGSVDESELLDAEVDSSARHRQWGAVCLETVNYIGSLRFKQLPTMVLHPEQEYYHKTVHSFSTAGPPQQLDSEFAQQGEQGEQPATDAGDADSLDTAEAVQPEQPHETTRTDDRSAGTGSEQQDPATTRSKL
jgi:hypothetical protein